MARCYVTTAITGRRLDAGAVLAVVQADVLARHHRLRDDRVRFLAGNVEGLTALRDPLALSFSDFIDTGHDPRHQPGVERFRRACTAAGDVYEAAPGDWRFRLSRHAGPLHDLITGGRLRIEPAAYREEVLAFLAAGVQDVSISQSWWSALCGYTSSLGHGTDGPNHRRWWVTGDQRIHVVGADSVRLHAVHWPAMLMSAGLPVPTSVLVHAELTGPVHLALHHGADAVRWWLLRGVPRTGTVDLPVKQLVTRANKELGRGLGSLVDRITVMVHRYRDGYPPASGEPTAEADDLVAACGTAPERVHEALTAFDFAAATAAVWRIVDEANRYAERTRPWELARAESAGHAEAGKRLDTALTVLLAACRALANQLTPFVPTLATRIAEQCFALSGSLAPHRTLYPRLSHPS